MINVQRALISQYPQVKVFPKPLLSPFISAIKKVIHQNDINTFLKQQQYAGPFSFVESVLDYFNFSYKISSNQIENIPASGRVVIIANHPLGALDALSLIHLIRKVRADIKVVANDMLAEIEQLKPLLVGVNSFENNIAKASVKEIHNSLENEEALIIFPSGEVSRARPNGVKDTQWHKGFLKFASKNQAPILPIHIRAKNSALFYTLSSLNKRLSSVLLAHEMFKQKNGSLNFTIGESIPFKSFSGHPLDTKSKVKLFKKHLYRVAKGKKGVFTTERCIAHPENRQILKQELDSVEKLGQTNDGKQIYLYEYTKGSIILQEIARLREFTFRKVEEGTGKKRDKDEYDYYYKHIILWDDEALEIAGAYRIAESNYVYENYNVEGFYTDSLFHFNPNFEKYLNNSIELGRSFVQPKYWGSRALDYLWQGIGAYLHENSHIKYLFGAVTLSGSMPKSAQELIIYYYDKYYGKHHQLLEPKNKFKFSKNAIDDLKYIFDGTNAKEDFKVLRDQLDYYGTTVPTLYKQYADLCDEGGISFMGYNIDKDFGDCVDSFILLEIDKIQEKKKNRYIKPS
ncbi:MAG: Putative hemolysin [uncultured Sulfurovum sp.]|uniref:Hemolysin n=1 Tax=uncultured Sulfurovum sp. TaxID=269237 RepID=A0A6S6T3C9_9BACT|nr:MAG: Putative hemolysin [uncultured Sulfurovum sp.]